MDEPLGRRDFVKARLTLAGLPSRSTLWPTRAQSKSLAGGPAMKTPYDPAAKFDLKVSEVEFRRAVSGRMLMARVYQPQGVGPFPTLLDLHGGAWNNKDRGANEPMDRAVAASGVLVVAIDLTLAPEAPYPASVQDGNYGVRWVKAKAADWNGEAANLGVLGSSSGGLVAQLPALRAPHARHNAIPLSAGADHGPAGAVLATRPPLSGTHR